MPRQFDLTLFVPFDWRMFKPSSNPLGYQRSDSVAGGLTLPVTQWVTATDRGSAVSSYSGGLGSPPPHFGGRSYTVTATPFAPRVVSMMGSISSH
jgi:hypothetical protein